MNLIQRVQDILLKPKETWPVIDTEAATPSSLYTEYLLILAAIPAIAGFIGLSIVGVGGFGVHVRMPFVSGLVNMVVGYVLSLVAVYALSLIVNALAPTFKGQKNPISALKLVVYGSTAGMLGGIFNLLPALGVLGIVAALYSVYLVYLGLPVLMKCPQDKAVGYTAVVIVCGVLMGIVLGALTALLPGRGYGGLASRSGGDVTISLPGSDVKIDTAKMDALAKKMEEAGKQMEAAQKSGDSAAAGKAMGDILGAVSGAGGAPIPAADLKALLPESLGELKRETIESQGGQAMGLAGSSAKATYVRGDKHVALSITDLGGIAGVAALAGWANVSADRETPDKVEKTYKQGQRTVKEEARKDGSSGEVTVLLANGVMVEAQGQGIDLPGLKAVVDGIGLDKLEAMKRQK